VVVLYSCRAATVAAVLAAVGAALPAAAQTPAPVPDLPAAQGPPAATAADIRAELDRMRQEFESVRDSYGARLSALEAKLAAIEGGTAAAPAQAPAPPTTPPPQTAATTPPAEAAPAQQPPSGGAQVPAGAAGAGGPEGQLPVYGNVSALSKVFNPDMAVIGNFVGAAGSNTIDPHPAMQLDEAEASFQAIVDPYARADFFLSAGPDGLDIEEGYITFPTLPGGLLMKVGKMKAQFGKVNTMHSHVLPWADVPLPMKNLLGGEEGLADSGISVSKLIANPFVFLEATGEIYKGDNDLFTSHKRGNLGYVGRLRGYRDVTEATNLDVGTSIAFGHNDAGPDFTTRVIGLDATLRYRPLRRAIYKRFVGRTELFWSRRQQPGGDASAFGAYLSGEYQFARRWFAGARYDWSDRAFDPSMHDTSGSLLLTYWPSEFSQVRGQFRRTRYAEGADANELLFQFLFSIGAHGAHVF
jgi:hypothetical protein